METSKEFDLTIFEETQLDAIEDLFKQINHRLDVRQQQLDRFELLLGQGQQIVLDFGKQQEEHRRVMKQNDEWWDEFVKQMQGSRSRIIPTSQCSAPPASKNGEPPTPGVTNLDEVQSCQEKDGAPFVTTEQIEAPISGENVEIDMDVDFEMPYEPSPEDILKDSSNPETNEFIQEVFESFIDSNHAPIRCKDPTISWGINTSRGQESDIEVPLECWETAPQLEGETQRRALRSQSDPSKVNPCPLAVVVFEEIGEMDGFKCMLADQFERSDAHKVFVKMPMERVMILIAFVEDRIPVSGEMGSIVRGGHGCSYLVIFDPGGIVSRGSGFGESILVGMGDLFDQFEFKRGDFISLPYDWGNKLLMLKFMEVQSDVPMTIVFDPDGFWLLLVGRNAWDSVEIDNVLESVDV